MTNLITREGKEVKTYLQLRDLQNVDFSETDTLMYRVIFNGEPCTIYRHWSNKDLGFYIYKGDDVSDCVAHIKTTNWFPAVDEKGNPVTKKYSDGSDSGIQAMNCNLEFESCEN